MLNKLTKTDIKNVINDNKDLLNTLSDTSNVEI